ncbi:MAG TPA: hypothetical protein VKX40_10120 [Aequorivita sp.]|nr:hypothetical protein [Aequorivita sp.]
MKKTILYLAIFTSIFSCSSDNSNSQVDILFGKWKLTAFVNETNGTILTEKDFENSNEIIIDFNDDYKFVGTTLLNDFFGTYAIDPTKDLMIFKELFSTEVNETDWGHLFFETLNLNYNQSTQNWSNSYKLSGDELKFYYSENQYMKFEKI